MRVISYLILISIAITSAKQLPDFNDNFISSIYKKDYRPIRKNDKKPNLHRDVKANLFLKYSKDKGKNVISKGLYKDRSLDSNQESLINQLRSYVKRRWNHDGRRARKSSENSGSTSSSSSLEMKNWRDEWKEHWLQKKLEAINSTMPRGDMVNMVAARPWGVPCGDPNQHDAPWGTCMLAMECEAEYRIYRGDYFCGRTKFICCALQVTNYDLYAGFDVSFAGSSLETDSEEKKDREKGSKERKSRKRARDRKRRLRERKKRKRKIKRTIRRIIREMRKILNRSFRNGTTARKKKTKQLKKFIEQMKQQYMKDRKAVQDIHQIELIKIDAALQKRLNEIKAMNQQFSKNSTFRDVIVNGTISRQNAKMLVQAYPELADMFKTRRRGVLGPKDYLDYDIEYGYLYY